MAALLDAVKEPVRRPGRRARRTPFRTETATLGVPSVNLDRALRIAGELEDDDLVRKIRSGK